MRGPLQRLALAFTGFAERWLPDAFVFALLATVVVFVAGLAVGVAPDKLVASWGNGFPDLLAFAMQMVLIIVTGYVVATARPVRRLIDRVADQVPASPRACVALVAIFAMLTAWVNWGFSLIFSAMLVRAIARRRPGVDYRALAAASLLGLGSVWAQGLSGSAALQMATPKALPENVRTIIANGGAIPNGIVDFTHTIFLWQSLVSVLVEIVIVAAVMWLATPTGDGARDAAALGINLTELTDTTQADPRARKLTPGERLEHLPILTLLIVALGGTYLVLTLRHGLTALTVNSIVLFMLLGGFLLHWTPARLMRAVREGVPATWGVILQFPFYAAIAGMIATTKLNERIAGLFVSASSKTSFPALMSIYSTALGVFVPSGGGKWVIEAPYVMKAAHQLHAHVGWVVASYDLGEALANLLQPFWMVPTLALLGLRARDVMGYTFLVFLVLLPVVLIGTVVLGATLGYPL